MVFSGVLCGCMKFPLVDNPDHRMFCQIVCIESDGEHTRFYVMSGHSRPYDEPMVVMKIQCMTPLSSRHGSFSVTPTTFSNELLLSCQHAGVMIRKKKLDMNMGCLLPKTYHLYQLFSTTLAYTTFKYPHNPTYTSSQTELNTQVPVPSAKTIPCSCTMHKSFVTYPMNITYITGLSTKTMDNLYPSLLKSLKMLTHLMKSSFPTAIVIGHYLHAKISTHNIKKK